MNNQLNQRTNPFDQQLNEINEWQDNANNPGYYAGSGRVPVYLKNIFKSPMIMLLLGALFLAPIIYSLINHSDIKNILSSSVTIIVGGGLFIGGIIRLAKKK